MLPFLAPIKESIWLRVTLLAFLSGMSSIGLWVLATDFLPASILYSVLVTAIITLLIAILFGSIIADYALQATDFLAKAILLVTREENQIEAPDAKLLGASKEFLSELAKSIYELASTSDNLSKHDNSELPFYRFLANSIPLPVIVLNKDRQISFANESALNYIGLPASEVINQAFYDAMNLSFVSSLTLESWLDDCVKNVALKNEIWERVRLNLPNNTRKQFDLAAHYSNNDPNGLETILVLYDRTNIYERDDHDLTFVALAVHELRTPLTIMRGYIEVFEDEIEQELNNEQLAFMYNMSASAQQLTSFVSNILNVSRVEENALLLHLKEEKWQDILIPSCKDMELRARVHNKKLVYDIAENLPAVAVDKVSIYEVLSNLIDNAIKYTHTDEDILIRAYEKDGMVETTVTDKGVGIPESLLGHVFDKFYRAHQNKNSTGGTGLGLYLSRAKIIANGGTIWVDSKEGKGSTFGFSLPLFSSVADQIKSEDNGSIVRGAHGWIKNHSLYRE